MTESVTTIQAETLRSRGATHLRATRRARMRRGFAALSVRTVAAPGMSRGFGGTAIYEEVL